MTDRTSTPTRRTALKTILGSDPAVTTARLLDAIEDWRNDDIETGRLLDVVHCWREEYSLGECVEAWRNDEIETGSLLYIRDLIRADASAEDEGGED